ncbi:WD repeat-containing protein 4, partial [Rhizophlyctis rosea]
MSHTPPFHRLLHLPHDDLLVLLHLDTVVVLNTTTGKIVAKTKDLSAPSTKPLTVYRWLAFDQSTNTLAIAADNKELACFDATKWEKVHTRESIKRANCVSFSPDGKLIIGDKFGDVYSVKRDDAEGQESLILGHVSMLTDLVFSQDGKFIITADRDEKIRVSHYPLAYDVEGFCLGHRSYVSKLHLLPFASDILLSGGGDPAILSWDWQTGQIIQKIDLDFPSEADPKSLALTSIHSHSTTKLIAVTLESQPYVLLYDAADPRDVKFREKVEVGTEVLDCEFDREGNLWVVVGGGKGVGVEGVEGWVRRWRREGEKFTEQKDDPLVAELNALKLSQ